MLLEHDDCCCIGYIRLHTLSRNHNIAALFENNQNLKVFHYIMSKILGSTVFGVEGIGGYGIGVRNFMVHGIWGHGI